MKAVGIGEIVAALQGAAHDIPIDAVKRSEYLLRLADTIEAHGIAPQDGWVLVPRKLTTEMLLARNSNSWPSLLSDEAEAIWDAFIAAAPEVKP